MSNEPEVLPQPTEAPRQLTFGEKAVGLTFNPGGHQAVNSIKTLSAALIDELNDMRNAVNSEESKAQFTIAIRSIQEGQMWGVKAATWQY